MPSQLLVTTLESLDKVESVKLSGSGLNAEDASMLAHALKSNTSVTSINLFNNAVGDEGASALADALKENTSITRIDLHSNTIGDSDNPNDTGRRNVKRLYTERRRPSP
jgi:Ran GTPase-activating protein (RanGAP) involved in mRNA processing and transport